LLVDENVKKEMVRRYGVGKWTYGEENKILCVGSWLLAIIDVEPDVETYSVDGECCACYLTQSEEEEELEGEVESSVRFHAEFVVEIWGIFVRWYEV